MDTNYAAVLDALRAALPGIEVSADAGTCLKVMAYNGTSHCGVHITEDALGLGPDEIARVYAPVIADELKGRK